MEGGKAIQKAMRKGTSLRSIERELGIYRTTIKKYLYADGPLGRRSRPALTAYTSDTIPAQQSDIYAAHLARHFR